MASEKILAQKQSYVDELKAKLDASQGGVVFNYGGITVEEDTKLRKELREAGVHYEVVKNTLLKIAINGTDLEDMSSELQGTTAIAIAGNEDPLAAARVLHKFSEDSKDKFAIKTGYMDGKVLSIDETKHWLHCPTEKAFSLCFFLLSQATSAVWLVRLMQLELKKRAKLLNLQKRQSLI